MRAKPSLPIKAKVKTKADKPGRLRIISGIWGGRLIAAPADQTVRPTAERTREALFNRLMHSFVDGGFTLSKAQVIDVCAGSGALGLEALSRGAAQVTFIEHAPDALALIRQNIATVGAEDRTFVLSANAIALPRPTRVCDLALLDPPYGMNLVTPILQSLKSQGWLRPGAVVAVETDAAETFEIPAGYTEHDRRAYGKAAITLLRAT